MNRKIVILCIVILGSNLLPQYLFSQELEPRALTNLPVGMNFALISYGYAQGNILLDPAVPIDDLNSKLNTIMTAYVRSIELFGLAGKVDVILPWAAGDWDANFEGIDTSRSITGFGDMRARLSVNFIGSPALSKSKFSDYQPKRISGASLQIIAPTGQYDPDRLINLGSNRWVFRPQWGFSQYIKNWILEAYIGAWFFTKNTSFYGGNVLKQNPLGVIKLHFIRSFYKKWWIALNGGYGFGGRTYINDDERESRISTIRLGLTFAVPVGKHHTIRLNGLSGIRFEQGADFDAIAISYQFRWFSNKKG